MRRNSLYSLSLFIVTAIALPMEPSKAQEVGGTNSSDRPITTPVYNPNPFTQPSGPDFLGDSGIFESSPLGLPSSLPTSASDIFTENGGIFESGSGSIPQVLDVIQSGAGDPGGDWLNGGNISLGNIWDNVLTGNGLPDYGSIFGSGALGNIDYSRIFGDVNIFGNSDFGSGIIKNLNGGNLGSGITNPDGTPQPSARPGRFNPFERIARWSQRNLLTPVFRALGRLGEKLRLPFRNSALGTLTRNSVVKSRDQANLIDQELARMMAEPRLGEDGEKWMVEQSEASLAILDIGTEQADLSVDMAIKAQELTSTQDVAKAVALIGGNNAKTIGTTLQMQANSQASLVQMEQLLSANLQVSANISEGIDESNRRERLERSSAFGDSAGEAIYLRGVMTTPTKAKKIE